MTKALALAWALVNTGRGRAAGCMLAIAVTFLLFGVTAAVDSGFGSGVHGADERALIVAHRASRQLSLPASYGKRIAALPYVAASSGRQWFGGWFGDAGNQFAQYVVDPAADLAARDGNRLSSTARATFLQRGDSVIVGRRLADRFGWHEGQRIRLESTAWTSTDGNAAWDFVIAGIFDPAPAGAGQSDANVMLINRRSFDERLPYARNLVGWYIVRLKPSVDSAAALRDIDALFAQEPAPTVTSTERAYAMHMLRQLGDVGAIAIAVSFAVFAALFLATSMYFFQSIMANQARISILRALGFDLFRLSKLVWLGTTCMCLVSAAAGTGLAAIAVNLLTTRVADVLPGLALPGGAVLVAVGVSLLLATVGAGLAAWRMRTFNVADLRSGA